MKRSVILACLLLAACSTDEEGCSPGEVRECNGLATQGRCQGEQLCLEDGSSYGSCMCSVEEVSAGQTTQPSTPAASSGTDAQPSAGGTSSGAPSAAPMDEGNPTDADAPGSGTLTDGSGEPPVENGTDATPDGSATDEPLPDETPTDDTPQPAPSDASATDESPDAGGASTEEPPPETDPPVVVFLLDQSSSMFSPDTSFGSSEPFGTAPDNWEGVRAALAELETVITGVEVGLYSYTGMIDGTCPLTQEIIEPGVGSPLSITYTLPNSEGAAPPFEGQTPTGESLQVVIDALLEADLPGARHIILLTDGDPDTCLHPNPQCGQDYTVSIAQNAWNNGISVHPVGLTEAVQQPFLESLAYAGLGLPVPPPLSPEQQDCLSRQAGSMGMSYDPNNWRDSALAEYADDDTTFGESLASTATDVTQLTDILISLMTEIRGG